MRTRRAAGIVAALMLGVGGCATGEEWGTWQAHPVHFASGELVKRWITTLVGLSILTVVVTACGTVTGAAVGAGAGAVVGAGTGYGAGKGALIGTGVGAAAGAISDITKK